MIFVFIMQNFSIIFISSVKYNFNTEELLQFMVEMACVCFNLLKL